MPTSLSTRALVTLAEAKEHLEIPTADTSRDQAIITTINVATGALEAVTGGPLVQLAITGDRYTGANHDGRRVSGDPYRMSEFGGTVGRSKEIFLRKYPTISVQQIVDESATPISILAADYYIRGKLGILEHFTVWPTPYKGDQVGEWVINHTAGWFADTASVAWEAKGACFFTVADLLQRKGGAINSIASGTLSVSFQALAAGIPNQARQLIGRYIINRA